MRTALAASVLVHAALIGLAVQRATGPRARPRERERVDFVELAPTDRTSRAEKSDAKPRTASPRLAKPPHGFQILIAPVDATVSLPSIDLTRLVTREADFSGRGVAGGGGGNGVIEVTEPVDEDRVDRPASLLPGQMLPNYPEALRDEAPDGIVVVRFVIDTVGRVETPSLSVMRATHREFVDAVRAALERLVYSPAQVDGHHVRVRTTQRFEFHLASR
jgi:protein TonB